MTVYYAKPGKTIEEHGRDLLSVLDLLDKYGYVQSRRIYDLAAYACLHHDDGKANIEFLGRVTSKNKRIKFNEEKEIPHNVLSVYLINPKDIDDINDYYRVCHAILYHHDYGNPLDMIKNKEELIIKLLKDFPTYPINRSRKSGIVSMTMDYDAIKIKGLLHKCDYSASGEYVAEYPNDFLLSSLENVKAKWQETNPDSDWNKLQKFCMEKREENIIIVAQTGMGKTEAGLQWIGNHKGYFILPLRTAINAIYDRVRKEILKGNNLETRVSILHSESLDYYLKQLEASKEEGTHLDESYLLEYEKRGKNLSMPLNISTMDQLFDFVFKYQGFELKLTTLAYSKIVIDEIQMYDPELLAYLIYGLKMIQSMGGKIAIMTATLSPFVKKLLMRELAFKEENIQTFVDDSIRHNVEVRDCFINTQDIIEKYKTNEKNGISNKILVICNTIKKAQKLCSELKESPEKINVHILHSRFTKQDRGKLEEEILLFGRTYDERGSIDRQSGIWVSTSLVEASLDIDFDYLFTELQDLNSLFQRMGRCNRKGKKGVEESNCFIYTRIDRKDLSSGNGFIDETIFNLSKQGIETVKGKLSEAGKLELLDTYLTMERIKGSEYYIKYKKTKTLVDGIPPYKYQKSEKNLRNILSQTIIPSPVYKKHKAKLEDMERQLQEETLSYVERMKLRGNILQYSVNIPYWQWAVYHGASKTGKAIQFCPLQMGHREEIPVMECEYSELGFRNLDYKKMVREPEFL